MNTLRILGRGRVGRGLHHALSGPGTTLLPGRSDVTGDIFVLAVPDMAVGEAIQRLAPNNPEAVFLHCAGALSLGDLRERLGEFAPKHLGAMHPLVSFADPNIPPELRGTSFAVAGSPKALRIARELTARCGAHVLLAEAKEASMGFEPGLLGPGYHAAAALMANGTAALANATVNLLRAQGVAQGDAERALAGLLRSVADNIAAVGVPGALSGPIMRGNAETVAAHREALSRTPDGLAAYDAVAPIILACAASQGLSPEAIEAINQALGHG